MWRLPSTASGNFLVIETLTLKHAFYPNQYSVHAITSYQICCYYYSVRCPSFGYEQHGHAVASQLDAEVHAKSS